MGLSVYLLVLASSVVPWYWWLGIGISGMGESLSAFAFEFRNIRRTHIPKTATQTNQIAAVAADKQLKSSVYESNTESQERPPRGLGIITSKFARKPFKGKMTRVTEASENRTELMSVNPLSEVDDSRDPSNGVKAATIHEEDV
jgi:hypothetical protein